MGRNSRDDYRWLVDELLALEEEEEPEDIPEDGETPRQWWEEDEEGRNDGWSYGVYDDEEFDEGAAVLAESRRQRKTRLKREKKQVKLAKKHRRKKRSAGAQLLLALLEILGILALLGWCLQWLT